MRRPMLALCVLVLLPPAAAAAREAAPGNDDRAAATTVTLPANVTGTTAGPEGREALVDVYRADGEQLADVTCAHARSGGEAALAFPARAGESYLVRVSQPAGSTAGAFDLALRGAPPQPRPPGPSRSAYARVRVLRPL